MWKQRLRRVRTLEAGRTGSHLGVAVGTERHSEECDSDVEQSDSCTCAYVARQMSAPPFTKDKPSPDKNRLKMQVFMLLRVILHSSYYSFTLK